MPESCYRAILTAWNERNADAFAAQFADEGTVVGFDGSEMHGRATIAAELTRIFKDHPTGRYVGKVREIRNLGDGVALLRAVAGIVPVGKETIEPKLLSVQCLVAVHRHGGWRIAHYANTPAAWHGRPEDVDQLADELSSLL